MPEVIPSEVLPAALAEHRAVRAWHQLQPNLAEPERIEILRLKHKTSVYRLCGAGRDGAAVVAKRCRVSTAGVERLVYEKLLPTLGVPVLRYFGWVPEAASEFCWLFLEDAGGEAYSPASEEHRALSGRWLAALHRIELSRAERVALPDRSPNHYLRLIDFSRTALQERVDNPALSAQEAELLRTFVTRCDLMQARWHELQTFFSTWPSAAVHGDFVVKNLRLRSGASGLELLVFDWEMAGWGVPGVDLAQFLGNTASPDLAAYGAALRRYYPQLTLGGVERLAAYGNLLRLVDKIFWEAISMEGQTYDFLVRPITTLMGYEPQLAAALRAVAWTTHD
jgi:aminoglycoside phosphotransferase (APT) family kinase protein